MTQGKTKGLQSKASNARHARKAAANPKKGKRIIAPKKQILIKQASMQKVHRIFPSGKVMEPHYFSKGTYSKDKQIY
jgi:hypothetical protein